MSVYVEYLKCCISASK